VPEKLIQFEKRIKEKESQFLDKRTHDMALTVMSISIEQVQQQASTEACSCRV